MESWVVHLVVDRAEGDGLAAACNQPRNDLVFGDGETDVMASPLRPPHPRVETQVATANRLRSLARASDNSAQARRSTSIPRALLTKSIAPLRSAASSHSTWQRPVSKTTGMATWRLTQCAQHFKPRHRRHRPVQQHEAYGQPLHCIEEGLAVAKFVHGEAVTNQNSGDQLAIEWVVVDHGNGNRRSRVDALHGAPDPMVRRTCVIT